MGFFWETIYILSAALIILIYPLFICAILAIVIGLTKLLTKRDRKKFYSTTWVFFLIGLPISFIGYLIGFMVGNSRTGEIGSLVSAVLGVIAGLNIFVVSSDRTKREMVGFSVCLLAIALFFGTVHGSAKREYGREGRLKNLSNQEVNIRAWRKNLNLPEDIPNWMTTGEPANE